MRRFEELSGICLSVPDIYKKYLAGMPQAHSLFEDSLDIMAALFANTINSFDLEAIILGGGVSNLPIWYEELPERISKLLFGPERSEIPVLKAQMGDSAGVLGAAYLGLRLIGAMDF
jgi:fructokinase